MDTPLVSLFRDWLDTKMSLISETSGNIANDWRGFIAEEARPRAQALGIEWDDHWIDWPRWEAMGVDEFTPPDMR